MFTVRIASQCLVRCAHHSSIKRVPKKRVQDPGIGLRKRILSAVDQKELELPDFDDLESDFMDVHKSHKEHLRQLDAEKEREKYLIVKGKYFKEKFPNFLTWHDKEHMRYLHRTDSEEWTVEKLSEGFPALPETIRKVIRSNWTKSNQNKISRHDESVQRNWELFKGGQMQDLPPHLKEHLNKFTSRALNFTAFIPPDRQRRTVNLKSNLGSEFAEIITSYDKIKSGNLSQIGEQEMTTNTPPLKDTYINSKSISRRARVTLEQLQEKLKKKLESGTLVDEEEKMIVLSVRSDEKNVKSVQSSDADVEVYQASTAVQVYEKPEKNLSYLNYPEKIRIPQNIHKKGFIYKLNDCYYDDDGEFLYRVPGMG